MLPDRYCRLLTAYVDGELPPRQQNAVQRLLQKSAEARALLRQLQENALCLGDLPGKQLGPEFAGEVLEKVASLQPAARVPATAGRSIPLWTGLAAAAAVLLAVGTASFLYFAHHSPHSTKELAQKPVGPAPAPEEPDSLLPQVLTVEELDKDHTQTRLARALKKEKAVHLELACKDSRQTVEGLRQVFAGNHIKFLVDGAAWAKLQKHTKTDILVFAENLRAEELASLLKRLGTREKATKVADRQIAQIHLAAMTDQHRQQLARLMGIKAQMLQPNTIGELPTFIEGTPGAKGSKKEIAPMPERFALVLARDSGSSSSPEIQQFLRQRLSTPGTLQVVLVLHSENA